ncbi:MAG: glycosyltransferase [Planctomycetaceae bacterium]
MTNRSSPPPALLITGMHRSGTSFAASLLQAAGVHLGDRLLEPHPSNPLGHFEELEFYEFDRHLLRSHGVPDDGFTATAVVEPGPLFHDAARRLVDVRRNRGVPWGWKDPRAALLLDFWAGLIPEARFLFVFRPPWDVVDSLYRRGDPLFVANPPFALDVWRHVNGRLIDFARRHPDRVLLREVSRMAAAPDELLADVRTRLGIPVEDAPSTFRPEFLSPAPADRGDLVARVAPECVELLHLLRELPGGTPAEDTMRAPPPEARDAGLRDWQQVRGLERREREAATALAGLSARARDAEQQATRLEGLLADAARDATAAAAVAGKLEAAELRAARAEARERDADGRIAALVAEARTAVIEADGAAEQRRRIAALEATVKALLGSTSWRLTAPLRAAGGLLTSHGRPFAARLTAHCRFLVRRLSSPTAVRRAAARAAEILSRDGVGGLVRAVGSARRLDEHRDAATPPARQAVVRMPLAPPLPVHRSRGAAAGRPLISIVMPVFDPPAAVLDATIGSVLAQTSPRWELIAVDDASTAADVRNVLERHAAGDPRIRVHRRDLNGGIAAATNTGVGLASGEFVAFLDHDDLLATEAIDRIAEAFVATAADAIYSDQDTVDASGRTTWTFHKPDWSPEYLRHVMYVGHLLVVRRELALRLGFKSEFDGVQDFEFMLRVGETTRAIAHLPEVLYHWRALAGSVAADADAKAGIDALQARAVQEHLQRLALPGVATPHPQHRHRCVVTPRLHRIPRVSIVIPSRDQPDLIGPCLDSITRETTYPDVEVVVVDTGTTDARALEILRRQGLRVVPFGGRFNFSAACNAGAAAATGEVLVFLNNDTTVVSPNWLEHLVFHLLEADVGAVGPLLVYPDGSVQHAGVVLGARGTADHVMRRFPADADGYAGSLSCPREVSAITGACLAMRREVFERLGGWNGLYATHYQDVDLCLRLRRAGLRCVFTPQARLVHHESPSRGERYDFLDRLLLIDTWRDELAGGDSCYPQACSLERLDYSPAEPASEHAHARH